MKLQDVLKDLEDAKSRKTDWRDIGRALNDVHESGRWRDIYETPSAWLTAVANASKLSEGFLRRIRMVYRFIAEWQTEHPGSKLLDTKTHFSLASAEILKRLHDIDPAGAEALLTEVSERKVAHHEVKTAYESIVGSSRPNTEPEAVLGGAMNFGERKAKNLSASKLGIRQTRAFGENAYKAVVNHLDQLSGRGEIVIPFRFYKFDFTAPQAVAVGLTNSGVRFADGFDFRNIVSSPPRGKRNQLLGEVALSSTYFRRYWLILPAKSPFTVALADDLEELDLHSVGIATWSADAPGELEVITKPRGNPVPDRQEIGRADVLRQGIPS